MILSRPLIIVAMACTFEAAGATETAVTTSSALFRVVNGHVMFPAFDSLTTEPQPLVEITAEQFPGHKVHDNRILIASGKLESKPFTLPDGATTLSLSGRSLPTMGVFPRIRVNLVSGTTSRELFTGYWQTLSLQTEHWKIPAGLKGKTVRLEIEFLNPATIEEQRTLWIHKAMIY